MPVLHATSRTIATVLLLLTLAATVLCAHAQTAAVDAMADTRHLLIIGASYAAEWGQPELQGYRVTNKGAGGEESWQVAARFARDALPPKPDLVLIWGHINDITRTTPDKYAAARERVKESYRQMLAQARAAGMPVVLATEITLTTAVDWRDWPRAALARLRGKESYAQQVNREVTAINAWMRELAAAENLPLLDLEQAVDDGEGGRKPEYTREDRSHITPAGYAAITDYVRERLPR
ncbi:MAG TPA: GDSL-type esterase/lipase family protein [Gammaproteobacteria bacterium]